MTVFHRLRLLVKSNIQLMSALTLVTAGVVFALIATYLYYWLHSPITLAIIWISGFSYMYTRSFLVSLRKKYKIDNGKYSDIAQKLMSKSNLSIYRLYIKKRKLPNASAISFGPMRSIVITSTLCKELSPEQLEAVLAHEVGHHVHNDVLVGTIFGATVLDALAFFSVFIYQRLHGGVVSLTIITFLLAIGALMVGALYSRHRENIADEYVGKLTGKPEYMAKALETMQRNYIEVQGWTMKEHPPLLVRLFATHAPIPKRVKALRHNSNY